MKTLPFKFPYQWRIMGRMGADAPLEIVRFHKQYHYNDWQVWRKSISHAWTLWVEKTTETKYLVGRRAIQ